MEGAILTVTAIVTVGWSVWNYVLWSERARLSEDSIVRFFIILAPGAYLLLIVLAGLRAPEVIRVDLIALALLSAVTVLCAVVLILVLAVRRRAIRTPYLWVFTLYNIAGAAIVVALHLVRNDPTLLIQVSAFIRSVESLDFFSFTWVSLDTERQQQDLIWLLNKVMIALLSYLPVSVIRFVSTSRQAMKLRREIDLLKRRMAELESKNRS